MSQSPLSWNKIPQIYPKKVIELDSYKLPENTPTPFLARGNGRSYGDVCLNKQGTLLKTRSLDQFITFNRETGILCAQAGILLHDILSFVVPQGWFLGTVPGTSLATLGGAVANDVHGKNHHVAGSFGNHVRGFWLIRSDDSMVECSRTQNTGLFYATIGGLGLTGLIAQVEVQLTRIHNPLMWCENRVFHNLDEYWQLNDAAQQNWQCAASWIDCLSHGNKLGRGVMFLGNPAPAQTQAYFDKPRQFSFPIELPFSLINHVSLAAFNELYFHTHKAAKSFLSHYRNFHFPLDGILYWNRIYGKTGFYQYQCVLPKHSERDGIRTLLDEIQRSGQGSFLAVLKSFGDIAPEGLLSFPRLGTTLALDFPNGGTKTLKLFERLDAIVRESQGALYPAKDTRMPCDLFELGYPKLNEFIQYIDPKFSSHFWQRMGFQAA